MAIHLLLGKNKLKNRTLQMLSNVRNLGSISSHAAENKPFLKPPERPDVTKVGKSGLDESQLVEAGQLAISKAW